MNKELVLKALGTVQEPDLHQDLVSLGMIRDVAIDGNDVAFTIMLTTPACPLKHQIEKEARDAVTKAGAGNVAIKLDSDVPNDGKLRGLVSATVKNAIAVASGKGGVGKSTVSVNLAVSLAKSGARVGLLDADIYGPNLPTMLGAPTMGQPNGDKLVPAQAYGVKMMSMGYLVEPGRPLIWRGPMLNSAIRQFITDVEWGELDYLVVDLPPGTGDAPLSLAQALPLSGVVIVTLPQTVSIEDASRGLEMFNTLKVPILGVIENMSYLTLPDGSKMDVFGNGGGKKMAEHYNVPFLGEIPMNPQVRIGGDTGQPIAIAQPDSDAGKALTAVAEKVAAQVSIRALSESAVDIEIV